MNNRAFTLIEILIAAAIIAALMGACIGVYSTILTRGKYAQAAKALVEIKDALDDYVKRPGSRGFPPLTEYPPDTSPLVATPGIPGGLPSSSVSLDQVLISEGFLQSRLNVQISGNQVPSSVSGSLSCWNKGTQQFTGGSDTNLENTQRVECSISNGLTILAKAGASNYFYSEGGVGIPQGSRVVYAVFPNVSAKDTGGFIHYISKTKVNTTTSGTHDRFVWIVSGDFVQLYVYITHYL